MVASIVAFTETNTLCVKLFTVSMNKEVISLDVIDIRLSC